MKTIILMCLLSIGLSADEAIISNPSFPGGEENFQRFVQQNLNYPEEALEENIETKTKAILQLDKRGRITKVEFPEMVEPFFQESIIQLTKEMPYWIPAKVNGEPVNASVNLSIQFALTD